MLNTRVWSRETLVIVQMMIIRPFLRCLLDNMMVKPVVPVKLHLHCRQTSLYLPYLSG